MQTTTTEPATGELDASRLTHLVGYAASRAAIEMRKVFMHHMAALDLKIVDFSILMLVAANPEVNQKRIGQALDISAPNMAVTLDRLVERDWVQRVRSDKDRRAQHIHLTAKGRDVVQRAEKISLTMEDSALRVLSAARHHWQSPSTLACWVQASTGGGARPPPAPCAPLMQLLSSRSIGG